jgi:hypothetical protein
MKELILIHNMWKEDCIIGRKLDEASHQTPMLHAKYLQLLSEAKMTMKNLEMQQKNLLKDKWLYYNGKMDQEQLKQKGWQPDPFNGLRIMKGDMDYYYDSDPEIQLSIEKIAAWKNIIDTLSEIMENIKWRHQTIGNIIKWKVFESGN